MREMLMVLNGCTLPLLFAHSSPSIILGYLNTDKNVSVLMLEERFQRKGGWRNNINT